MLYFSGSPDYSGIISTNPVGVNSEVAPKYISGTLSETPSLDAIVESGNSCVIDNNYFAAPRSLAAAEFTSLLTGVSQVNEYGEIERVSDGESSIFVKLENKEAYQLNLQVSRSVGQSFKKVARWVDGSLTKYITDQIDDLTSISEASEDTIKIFSLKDSDIGAYGINPNLWYKNFNKYFSSFNFWQTDHKYGDGRHQTLITKRHIIGSSDHFNPISIGGTHRFIAADGSIVERQVTHSKIISGTNIQISLLDSNVPNYIRPSYILPSNIEDYLPNINLGIPCLMKNQLGHLNIEEFYSLNNSEVKFKSKNYGIRNEWRGELSEMDAGSPCFFVINNKTTLVCLRQSKIIGTPLHSIDWSTEIESLDALASIDTGYTPSEIDLSSFDEY